MDMLTPQALFPEFQQKLDLELQVKALSQKWKIYGRDALAHHPVDHQELAPAVSLVLDNI